MENAEFEKLLEELGSNNSKYWTKARYELVQNGREVTEYLIKALKHEEPIVRGRVARILGEIGDNKAVHSLIKLVKSETDNYVLSSSIKALAMLGDKNAVNTLIEKLDALEGKVRKEAAQALGDLKDTGAMEPIKKYYNESSEEERIWATYALIKLGQKDLIHTLEDNLKEEVFISAINVAGELKLKESAPILLELLQNSKNINIKIEVIKSLAEIGGKHIQEELNKYYEKSSGQERIWLIYALAKMKDKSKTKIIIDLLNKNVRKASAVALGKIGNPASAEVLAKALKNDDKDIRYNVVRAMEKLNNGKTLAYLKKALEDEKDAYVKIAIDDAICELEKGEAL